MTSLSHLSLRSTDTHTSYETLGSNSTDSASSEWVSMGIGSVAGKAIHAVGKAELRMVQIVLVRRRLSVIERQLSRNGPAKEIRTREICEDLLELSKPGTYGPQIRRRALKTILSLIQRRQNDILIRMLGLRTGKELQMLVSGLVEIVEDDSQDQRVDALVAFICSLALHHDDSIPYLFLDGSHLDKLRRSFVYRLLWHSQLDTRIYTSVLSYCTPDHSTETRKYAMQFILHGLHDRVTNPSLIGVICQWSEREVELFAVEFVLMTSVNAGNEPPTSQLTAERHVHRALKFICSIVQFSQHAPRLLMDVGFLDLILAAYVQQSLWLATTSEMLESCNAILQECAVSYPEVEGIITQHPIFGLWPTRVPFFMRGAQTAEINTVRSRAWRKVDRTLVQERLHQIDLWWNEYYNVWDRAGTLDVCVDLLEFKRSDVYGSDIAAEATLHLDIIAKEGPLDIYRRCCEEFDKLD